MAKKTGLWLAGGLFVLIFGFAGERGMAQYTDEFIICRDGRSAEACRDTAVPPDNDGVVTWGRNYGNILCVGVGFEPQKTDCNFLGASYNGFGCQSRQDIFGARVPAGGDLAIACGEIGPLENGNYSAKATSNNCFVDEGICGSFILVNFAP